MKKSGNKLLQRKLVALALVCLFCLRPGDAGAQVDWERWESEANPKWTALFNGRDLKGWTPIFLNHPPGENPGQAFRVVDGAVTVSYDKWDAYNYSAMLLIFLYVLELP